MPGGAVADHARGGVDEQVAGRDVLAAQSPAERLVHTGQHGRRTLGVIPLRRERHLDHRSNQGGRNAVAGDIGHEDADALGVNLQEIVEVARDRRHRPVSCGDGEGADSRHRLRQQRRLDLPRDGEFSIDDGQPLGLRKHAPRRDGAEANDEDREAERLESAPARPAPSCPAGCPLLRSPTPPVRRRAPCAARATGSAPGDRSRPECRRRTRSR